MIADLPDSVAALADQPGWVQSAAWRRTEVSAYAVQGAGRSRHRPHCASQPFLRRWCRAAGRAAPERVEAPVLLASSPRLPQLLPLAARRARCRGCDVMVRMAAHAAPRARRPAIAGQTRQTHPSRRWGHSLDNGPLQRTLPSSGLVRRHSRFEPSRLDQGTRPRRDGSAVRWCRSRLLRRSSRCCLMPGCTQSEEGAITAAASARRGRASDPGISWRRPDRVSRLPAGSTGQAVSSGRTSSACGPAAPTRR